jgi:hypothetical protein
MTTNMQMLKSTTPATAREKGAAKPTCEVSVALTIIILVEVTVGVAEVAVAAEVAVEVNMEVTVVACGRNIKLAIGTLSIRRA